MTPSVIFAAQSTPSDLTGLVGWVADVVATLGPVGVALLLVLENVFPPIPSEVILPLAGYLASQGRMAFLTAVVASTLGALAGAWVLYGTGHRLGHRRLDALLRKVPLIEQSDLEKAQQWFQRHGGQAVFVGRFVPGVRSLISLPAGTERMTLGRFTLYTTVGSALWNAALITAGLVLGGQWKSIGEYSDYLNYALYAALAVAVTRFVWKRRGRIGSDHPS